MKTLQHTNKRPILTNLHDQFLHVHENIALQYSGQWFCLLSHYYFCTAGLAYDNSIIQAIIVSHERPLTFSSPPPPRLAITLASLKPPIYHDWLDQCFDITFQLCQNKGAIKGGPLFSYPKSVCVCVCVCVYVPICVYMWLGQV